MSGKKLIEGVLLSLAIVCFLAAGIIMVVALAAEETDKSAEAFVPEEDVDAATDNSNHIESIPTFPTPVSSPEPQGDDGPDTDSSSTNSDTGNTISILESSGRSKSALPPPPAPGGNQ